MTDKNPQSTSKTNQLNFEIIKDTEAFWHNNEKWVIYKGNAMPLSEAPICVQDTIALIFLRDKKNRDYLKKIGYTSFAKAYDRWYQCVFRGLSKDSSFRNAKLKPEMFTWSCDDHKCNDRGKLCRLADIKKK